MGVQRWSEWGKAVVHTMVEVKPGEDLLILADTGTDRQAAEACLTAGINAEAQAQLLVLPRLLRADAREFKPASAAITNADAIVDLSEVLNNVNVRAWTMQAREKGARVASCAISKAGDWAVIGVLDVDYPLMVKVAERICALSGSARALCSLPITTGVLQRMGAGQTLTPA